MKNSIKEHFVLMGMLILFLLSTFPSCSNRTNQYKSESDSHENIMRHAKGIIVYRTDSSYVAEIKALNDSTKIYITYVIPDDGITISKKQYPGNTVIVDSTIRDFLVYTSVHGSAISELDATNRIKMVVDAQYFKDQRIINAIKSGKIIDAGTSAAPVAEVIIKDSPDAAIVSLYDGMNITTLNRLNLPIIFMAENLEQTPLGRAEWIKFLGIILNKKEQAEDIFSKVEKEYNAVKESVNNISKRPKVMLETMYQGVWYMAGGKSCQSQMIKDAGGEYVYMNNHSTGGIPLSFEEVLSKSVNADIWLIHVYGRDLTLEGLRSEDERYALFKPFKIGNIWYTDTEKSNIFEDISFHPERVLSDYSKIFRSDKSSAKPLYYKSISN